jgi:site-specific DNA-methyltransferase (adenine-specific)
MNITNEDNMDLMARYDDNHFDLAIVDPPYGIGFGEFNRTNKTSDGTRVKANKYKHSKWDDSIPTNNYFIELKRNPVPNFSDGELAYTSFNKVAKQFDFRYYGGLEGNTSASNKIHPTQKPIALYEWLLMNYAKEGDKILDTHLGSGSIAIACHNLGFDLTACELDKEYYDSAMKRLNNHKLQQKLF